MWKSGITITKIANHFGLAKATVCYRLKQVDSKEYRAGRKNLTKAQSYALRARAYKLRQEGKTFRRIAEIMGSAHSTAVERVKFMERVIE